MEKIYEVTMSVRQKSLIPLQWEVHKFRVFGKTADEAKTKAVLDALGSFPIDDWEYDQLNPTVEEISHEQIGQELEDRRAEIQAGQQERLQEVRDELAKIGVILPQAEIE